MMFFSYTIMCKKCASNDIKGAPPEGEWDEG